MPKGLSNHEGKVQSALLLAHVYWHFKQCHRWFSRCFTAWLRLVTFLIRLGTLAVESSFNPAFNSRHPSVKSCDR